ncbi:Protein NDRG3 [Halotydeus destructor]|nr:Protein NDRG3 [Halotydeus destructor]
MADIELRGVEATSPLMRSLSRSEDSFTQERVETQFGSILVAHQGVDHRVQKKPVLITYHDIGLNHVTNFQAFFNYVDMKFFLESFSVLHINAPGQEDMAVPLPDNYTYPTLAQLSEQISDVCSHFAVTSFVGLAAGFGANVMSRYALQYPDIVDGLFLINSTSTVAGWTEWLYQKVNMYYLGGIPASALGMTTFPQSTQDYLLWHHFGRVDTDRNRDLITVYRKHFSGKSMSGRNLSLLIDSYIKRNDLNIVRNDKERNFKCPVLLLTGDYSPHVDDTVDMNARLNPSNSTWMKLMDCGMPLEEQPGKVAEALRLFIQGLGYSLAALDRRRSSARKQSMGSDVINGNFQSQELGWFGRHRTERW